MKQGAGTRAIGLLTVLFLVGGALMFLGLALDEFSRRGFEYVVIALLGEAVIYGILMLGPVGKALAKLLEVEGNDGDPQLLDRLNDLEYRLSEMSGEVQRVNELDSRIEFAERMLARPASEFSRDDLGNLK